MKQFGTEEKKTKAKTKAKGLRHVPYTDAICSRCFSKINGEGVEVYEYIGIPQVRTYHLRCFVREYTPIFERLRAAECWREQYELVLQARHGM